MMKYINGFFYKKLKNFTLNTTFNIPSDKIIAIIGESGSGKTTFLKCISGLIKSKIGFLNINKYTLQNSKKNIFINANERQIGQVFQNPCLFPNINVLQNITFGLKKNKKKIININEKQLIKILNLEKLKNRKINEISGGEKQRISIAQIILTQPKLILLDEVLSSQDINMKKKLILLFKNINYLFKIPIIYVSHDIKNIHNLTNKIIYINKGKINYLK